MATCHCAAVPSPRWKRAYWSWSRALRRFAGISNLPAVPRAPSPSELAPYEGRYTSEVIGEHTIDSASRAVATKSYHSRVCADQANGESSCLRQLFGHGAPSAIHCLKFWISASWLIGGVVRISPFGRMPGLNPQSTSGSSVM